MKILRFLKDWTLPVAMGVGISAYLLFASVPALDAASLFFVPVFSTFLPIVLFLVLFTNFCKVDTSQMHLVRWHLWVTLLQVLLSGILLALILVLKLQGEVLILAEAVLICVIGPCAAAAPVVTAKLGGSLEDMTTYTFVSNLITAILIPTFFPLINPSSDIDFHQAFLMILYRVCMVLLVPMLLALIVKRYFHRFHRWILSVTDLSYYLWALCLCLVTGTTVRNIAHANTSVSFLLVIAGSSLLVCLGQFWVGRFMGRPSKRVVECGQALGQKNTSFAIWIACVYLTPLSSVGPGCYILWQNLVNSFELWHQRHTTERLSNH